MTRADWDIGGAAAQLYTAEYVSAPSSLHNTPVNTSLWAVARHDNAQAIDQGRIVTWVKRTDVYAIALHFRWQAVLGDPQPQMRDRYIIDIYNKSRARHVSSSGRDWDGGEQLGIQSDVFVRVRATWWNGTDLSDNPALVILLEKLVSGVWTQLGKWYDTNNFDKGGSLNRVGVSLPGTLGQLFLIDDTEIWRAS